jgi:general secretion pathway protein K
MMSAPPPTSRRNGFALPLVIWGLGIIALLIVSFMTTARWRVQAAYNIYGAAKADLLADSAVNIGLLRLLAENNSPPTAQQSAIHDGRPKFCSLSGAAVAIAIEDEGGKVDLNSASSNLLRALFAGFGVEQRKAEALADAVVAYRVDPGDALRHTPVGLFARKPASFHTALELDQVPGVEAQLFRMLTPFVTVHSHQPGLYAQAAPPALFAALAGFDAADVAALTRAAFSIDINRDDPHFPSEFKRGAASGAFLVHAEAVLPSGQTGVSEAIFDMRANGAAGYALRETRRGTARNLRDLRLLIRQGSTELQECL